MLVFSKAFYTTSLNTYFTFYLISRFHLSLATAQIYLFVFLASVAAGTLIGGPLSDRIGRKSVMWGSILGVLPFTLLLPHASLFWTVVLIVVIGLTLASASSTIIVYALDLVPGKIGTIAGLFFGLSFGLAGVGAALLGRLADATSIEFVYQVCAFLPAIGLLTVFLPNLGRPIPPAGHEVTSPRENAGGGVGAQAGARSFCRVRSASIRASISGPGQSSSSQSGNGSSAALTGERLVLIGAPVGEQLQRMRHLVIDFERVAVGVGEVKAALIDVVGRPHDGDAVPDQMRIGVAQGGIAADLKGDVPEPDLAA